MRLTLAAVGRMKDGPERELVARYVKRASDAGRALGFSGPDIAEIAESRAPRPEDRRAAEGAALLKTTDGALLACLDERGTAISSEALATFLQTRRDGGTSRLMLAIGGADGLPEAARAKAAAVWSFGAATFPHQIVRILAAEQLYRAMTILSGHPYHRS